MPYGKTLKTTAIIQNLIKMHTSCWTTLCTPEDNFLQVMCKKKKKCSYNYKTCIFFRRKLQFGISIRREKYRKYCCSSTSRYFFFKWWRNINFLIEQENNFCFGQKSNKVNDTKRFFLLLFLFINQIKTCVKKESNDLKCFYQNIFW